MASSVVAPFSRPIYLGAASRTPIGKYGGSLLPFSAPQLAALALKAAREKFQTPNPDFVFMGHARQAGAGPNPARQAAVFSGLSETLPAVTVNQACASGLASIISAAEKILVGKATSIWAGGVESMSNTPYLARNARWGMRFGHSTLVDGMHQDGFFCPMADMVMGATVDEYLAKELNISRKEQDTYAALSQERAAAAWNNGSFAQEVIPLAAEGKFKGLLRDEHLRPETTLEKLAQLPPVFDPKTGSVTAGNSSGITDGAAWLHVSANQTASAFAELVDYEVIALDPKRMGLGPIAATQNLLKRHKLQARDLEAVEINEAFAAQIIACQRELRIPEEKLNAWGGAIAIGHPIGATGTRITVTLLHRLKGKPGALGLATLCVSGGQGVALLVRSLN